MQPRTPSSASLRTDSLRRREPWEKPPPKGLGGGGREERGRT